MYVSRRETGNTIMSTIVFVSHVFTLWKPHGAIDSFAPCFWGFFSGVFLRSPRVGI
jgi:hypothetical protein